MKKKDKLRVSHPDHEDMFLCETCFCWDGECYKKPIDSNQAMWIRVSCLCNSIKCKKCGFSRKVSGSSIWELIGECIAYVPYFPENLPCSRCGSDLVIN